VENLSKSRDVAEPREINRCTTSDKRNGSCAGGWGRAEVAAGGDVGRVHGESKAHVSSRRGGGDKNPTEGASETRQAFRISETLKSARAMGLETNRKGSRSALMYDQSPGEEVLQKCRTRPVGHPRRGTTTKRGATLRKREQRRRRRTHPFDECMSLRGDTALNSSNPRNRSITFTGGGKRQGGQHDPRGSGGDERGETSEGRVPMDDSA